MFNANIAGIDAGTYGGGGGGGRGGGGGGGEKVKFPHFSVNQLVN
jgi:hypothetical protein